MIVHIGALLKYNNLTKSIECIYIPSEMMTTLASPDIPTDDFRSMDACVDEILVFTLPKHTRLTRKLLTTFINIYIYIKTLYTSAVVALI